MPAEGYSVDLARTEPDGLAMARYAEPGVLLLDWMPPGLSGLELCETLWAEGRYFPVLRLSTLSKTECPLTNVVDVYVCRLRRKIDEGHLLALIKTVRGFGYRLDATAD